MELEQPTRDPNWHVQEPTALGRVVARTRSWWQANALIGTYLVVAVMATLTLVWGSGEVYEGVADSGGIAPVDQPLLTWMVAHRTPAFTSAVVAFTEFGGPVIQPIVLLVVTLGIAWAWRSWAPLVLVGVAVGTSTLATVFGKQLFGRARPPIDLAVPPLETTASFPSGHTLNGTVIAGILCYLMLHWFRRASARAAWIVGFSLYALSMGMSRVYLGHHWLTDVLVGWTLGLAWVLVVIGIHRVWLLARARHGQPAWMLRARRA